MSRSPAIELLNVLRERGLEVTAANGQVRFRPRRLVTSELLEQMTLQKLELLALLTDPHGETPVVAGFGLNAGSSDRPCPASCPRCGERDFTRPRAGGAWRCARCVPFDLPGDEVEWWPRVEGPFVPLDALLELDRTHGASARSNPFHQNEFGSKIEV